MRKKSIELKNSDNILKLCQDDVLKCRDSLKKQFIKLEGRNFGAYQSKKIDKFLNMAYEAVKLRYFGEFSPNDEQIPLCVIAIGSYAFSEVSVKSSVDLAVIYKQNLGFNAANLANDLVLFLEKMGLDIKARIFELDSIFSDTKDDLELKTMFAQYRFVCASKKLYLLSRDEINKLKDYKSKEFIQYHLNKLSPFDDIAFLSQRPDLKNGYGGFYDYKRIFWLLNSVCQNPKSLMLKYMSEDEIAALNLSVDYISSLRSALQINGGEDVLENNFLSGVSELMQTKEKKMLDAQILLLIKTLFSMQNIAVFSRFLARSIFRKYLSKFTFSQLRFTKQGRFYIIENCAFLPLHAKNFDIKELLAELNSLPDIALKFGIEAVVNFQKTSFDKNSLESSYPSFIKLFYRQNCFGILKVLLDGETLFHLIKPMERTRHLARLDGYKFSVDEYSLLCVYYLENIKDKFIKTLYDELCADAKALLKIVALIHEVALGQGGDHNVTGANIFRSYATKIGLSSKLTNMGVVLIKNHSLMNSAALGKQSWNSILTFISHIGDKQALKMLYILTYAMVSATNDGYYGELNAKMLRELYENALASFDNCDEDLLDEAAKRAKKEDLIKKQKAFIEANKTQKDAILSIKSNLLFVKYSASDIVNLAFRALECQNIAIELDNENGFKLNIIAKRGWNMTMVLNKLSELDLAYMELFELFDNKFFLKLEFNKSVSNSQIKNMQNVVMTALCDKDEIEAQKPEILSGEFTYDINYSPNYAKININAKDKRGLMAFVLSTFERFELKLANARIQTIKNRTRNLFFVEKSADLEEKLIQIKKILTGE